MTRSVLILVACAVLTTGCGSSRPPEPISWEQAFGNVPEESINKDLDQIQHDMKQTR